LDVDEAGVGTVVKNIVLFTTILSRDKNNQMRKIFIQLHVVNRRLASNKKTTVQVVVRLIVANDGKLSV
jgi:hypothetical protein